MTRYLTQVPTQFFFNEYFLINCFIYTLWFYKWWEHLFIKGSSIKPIFPTIWAWGGSSLDACGLSLPCGGGLGEGFKTVDKLLALNMEAATTCFMDEETDTLLSLILLSGILIWWKFVLKHHDMIPFVVQFSEYLSLAHLRILSSSCAIIQGQLDITILDKLTNYIPKYY